MADHGNPQSSPQIGQKLKDKEREHVKAAFAVSTFFFTLTAPNNKFFVVGFQQRTGNDVQCAKDVFGPRFGIGTIAKERMQKRYFSKISSFFQ